MYVIQFFVITKTFADLGEFWNRVQFGLSGNFLSDNSKKGAPKNGARLPPQLISELQRADPLASVNFPQLSPHIYLTTICPHRRTQPCQIERLTQGPRSKRRRIPEKPTRLPNRGKPKNS
jgi:hypothetical protein